MEQRSVSVFIIARKIMQLKLSTMATLRTEESGGCGEVAAMER